MERHFRTLGYLFVALAIANALFLYYAPGPVSLGMSRDAYILAAVFGVMVPGALSLMAGWALLAGMTWARTISAIASAFALLTLPWGTAVGIYGIWVLITHRGKGIVNPHHRLYSP